MISPRTAAAVCLWLVVVFVGAAIAVAWLPAAFDPPLHILRAAPILVFVATTRFRLLPRSVALTTLIMQSVYVVLALGFPWIVHHGYDSAVDLLSNVVWYGAGLSVFVMLVAIRTLQRAIPVAASLRMTTTVALVLLAFAVVPTPASHYAHGLGLLIFFLALRLADDTPQGNEARLPVLVAVSILVASALAGSIALAVRSVRTPSERIWQRKPRIAVVGSRRDDPRPLLVVDAVGYWNAQLAAIGSSFRIGPVSELILPAPTCRNLQSADTATAEAPYLNSLPAEIIVVLTDDVLTSFVHDRRIGDKVVVVITSHRAGFVTAPNVMRNVIAHELGHAIGIQHNADPATLMCGAPARCRPDRYVSAVSRYFPLSPAEMDVLRRRYPRQ